MALKAVNSFILFPNYQYGGSTATIRLYYTENFVDNEGRAVFAGAVGSNGFFDEVPVTIVSEVGTAAAFNLITTEDSDHPNARVIGALYDSDGTFLGILFDWAVPSNGSLAPPTTFAVLQAYNSRNTLIVPSNYYMTQSQITALVTAMLVQLGIVPATQLVRGLVRLRVAAAAPADPEVYGTNDPLVRDALSLLGVSLDATMAVPANTNVPVYDSASGKWKPGVGTQGAAGGDLSGTYPNPTVASIPLHASSHELGGSDAIKLDNLAAPDDNTDLNASTTAHGLLLKLNNNAAAFLNGQGAWSTPAGSGDVAGPGASTDNAVARFDSTTGKIIQNSNLTVPDDAASTEVGYLNVPQNSQSAPYTTVMADRGKHIYHPSSDNNARTFTIDSNANVAYPVGTAITFVNEINTVTIAITADTLTLMGAGTTGSRTLAANGIATALKVASTKWVISGTGLT